MDFGRAFTYFKDDDRWTTKIGIGAVVMLLSILLLGIPTILLVGYQIAVTRQVMNGKELPLPEWDDWGKLFMDGFYLVVAVFVYTLPLWLIFCLSFGGFFLIPFFGGNEDLTAAIVGVSTLVWVGMGCLLIILLLGLAVIVPGIYIQYIRTNEFGALFRIGEVFGIVRENIADILLSIVGYIGGNLVISLVSSVLSFTVCIPIILIFIGPVWLYISMGHIYGQIAAKNKMVGAM